MCWVLYKYVAGVLIAARAIALLLGFLSLLTHALHTFAQLSNADVPIKHASGSLLAECRCVEQEHVGLPFGMV
jgi:hypothetical protein